MKTGHFNLVVCSK